MSSNGTLEKNRVADKAYQIEPQSQVLLIRKKEPEKRSTLVLVQSAQVREDEERGLYTVLKLSNFTSTVHDAKIGDTILLRKGAGKVNIHAYGLCPSDDTYLINEMEVLAVVERA